VERDKSKTIGIGWANFAAVAMETKKVRFKNKLDSFQAYDIPTRFHKV
jgi:hypothetical protein